MHNIHMSTNPILALIGYIEHLTIQMQLHTGKWWQVKDMYVAIIHRRACAKRGTVQAIAKKP